MQPSLQSLIVAILLPVCLASTAVSPRCISADESTGLITVHLVSGRKFTGQVDARTSPDELWLRFGSGPAVILRPIRWERITAARRGGIELELSTLKELCQGIETAAPRPALRPAKADEEVLPPPAPQPAPAHVESIRVDAWLANWDRDLETDGLMLQLTPVDETGKPVAASGTIEVELFAAQQRKYHEVPQGQGYSVSLIQRWSEQVQAAEADTDGILLRLPFHAIHPEFRGDVAELGLVHVRLTIAGSGVIERSLDGVRLRNWSPVRDSLLNNTGHRFLGTEATGREQGAYFTK